MKVKPKDPVAYTVAKRAAGLQMTRAAKWRVQAQNAQAGSVEETQAARWIQRAEQAERLAREWLEKAQSEL